MYGGGSFHEQVVDRYVLTITVVCNVQGGWVRLVVDVLTLRLSGCFSFLIGR